MAEHTASHSLPTVEEYLKTEETSTVRHEYVAGVIHAMTGATKRHNRIVGNIYRRLADAADAAGAGDRQVYFESVKLRASDDIFYYPDIMVARDPDDEPFYETGPCLLVEVTSPSTESIDRREKLAVYKSIPSLKGYLIVEQNRRVVERYWRDEEGEWRQAALYNKGSVPIPCPETTLALGEIYEGLQ